MKVLTGKQMAEIDKKAIEELKIDGLILMENAGIKLYSRIKDIINKWNKNENSIFRNVVIICGKGNNGGDGFVLARHLILNKIPVTTFAIAELKEYSGDALKNYLALENFGDINIITEDTIEDLRDSVTEASIIVDALLGTGLKGMVDNIYADIINVINEAEGIIVSVDIPSGVNADTGEVESVAVEADFTETFAAPKLGQVIHPGSDCVGELNIADIGIPETLIDNSDSYICTTDESYVFDLLPWRPENSNKGNYGKVLTIAGHYNMTGAGLLTAFSALKIGAGLSVLAAPDSLIPYYAGTYPEITFLPLKETKEKTISASAIDQLMKEIDTCKAIVLGPGIGITSDTIEFTKKILEIVTENKLPIVIDADALNCMAQLSGMQLCDHAVITPHPKEMSRILDMDLDEVLSDRIKSVEMACEKYSCNVVLKGAKTLIGSNESININLTGNSALATAGTGDVLSGIIGGLIAQGMYVIDASVCGVYLHGLAGDLASKDLTEYSVVASDVITYIPKALKHISS